MPFIVAVAIVGVSMNPEPAVKTSKSTQIAFKESPKKEPATNFSVDAEGNISSSDSTSEVSNTGSVTADTGNGTLEPEVSQTILATSQYDHPGAGTFDLPFTTSGSWSVDFSYACDTGKVNFVVFAGSTPVIAYGSPVGPFNTTNGMVRINVPEAQNCTWQVSVS